MMGFFILKPTVISIYAHSPDVPEIVRGQVGNFRRFGYHHDPKSIKHFHSWLCKSYQFFFSHLQGYGILPQRSQD